MKYLCLGITRKPPLTRNLMILLFVSHKDETTMLFYQLIHGKSNHWEDVNLDVLNPPAYLYWRGIRLLMIFVRDYGAFDNMVQGGIMTSLVI
jgi:hypothetical protein